MVRNNLFKFKISIKILKKKTQSSTQTIPGRDYGMLLRRAFLLPCRESICYTENHSARKPPALPFGVSNHRPTNSTLKVWQHPNVWIWPHFSHSSASHW
ncbi:hypothetical protein QL285_087405 [Trifolium repens]|nr:hypothetical protein QL285_087405 [Trifolium repens]